MKREDMNVAMRLKIVESAMQEFNMRSYEKASMNHICQIGKISKGIIYHYFKDKDELYLECVKICFQTIVDYYHKQDQNYTDMKHYMGLRISFFKVYPHLRGIFFYAILQTPQHLKKQVVMLKQEFDNLNHQFYKNYLMNIHLREDISFDLALEYYDMMQNAFNEYFHQKLVDGNEFDEIVNQHEEFLLKWFDMMLYGIAREE